MLRRILARLRARLHPEDEFTSEALRARFAAAHGIRVGLYSYGCFDPNRIGRETTIGRYCSFAPTGAIYTRNHGLGFLALTPYLYNTTLGVVAKDPIAHSPCVVGDDVWMGHNAVVLPGASRIGRGAVIAAGAVVTRDVPAYAIVAGNPARVVRLRFDEATIARIEATRWWEWDLDRLRREVAENPGKLFEPAVFFRDGPAP